MDEYEALVHDGKRKIVLKQKPVPLQLCPPQIPQLPAWDWTWESARWGQWLAVSSTMSWRYIHISWCWQCQWPADWLSWLSAVPTGQCCITASCQTTPFTGCYSSYSSAHKTANCWHKCSADHGLTCHKCLQTFHSSIPSGGSLQCSLVCSGKIVRMPFQNSHWALPSTVHSLYMWYSIAK